MNTYLVNEFAWKCYKYGQSLFYYSEHQILRLLKDGLDWVAKFVINWTNFSSLVKFSWATWQVAKYVCKSDRGIILYIFLATLCTNKFLTYLCHFTFFCIILESNWFRGCCPSLNILPSSLSPKRCFPSFEVESCSCLIKIEIVFSIS